MPHKDPEAKRKYHMEYNRAHRDYAKQWRSANKERQAVSNRAWKYRNKYGITVEEYQQRLAAQNGCCAICKAPSSRNVLLKNFNVDHDHVTGEIRGLLCHPCNTLLGKAERLEVRLYLQRLHPSILD